MSGLILRRLAQLPLILLVIYTLTLALAWAVPGNPLEAPEGRRPQPEIAQAMQRQYNLDSFWRFYWSYLDSATGLRWARSRLAGEAQPEGAEPLRVFDLGPSLQYEDWRVTEIIASSLPVSAAVGSLALLIALLIGVTAGVTGALRPGSLADGATLAFALIGLSQPVFVTGSLLLLAFSVSLGWFPIAGVGPRALVLPALTLSLPVAAYVARLVRVGLAEALGADYVVAARARGISRRRAVLTHALKVAFLPVLSYLGPAGALALTGSFVVERVFSVPGMGQHFVNAVQNKDLFLLMGVVLVSATLLVLLNLAVDVLYRFIDPRIE
jgi:oligopeptide transport system permease protein